MDVKIAGSSPGDAAFEKFKLCRSSTFENNKFDIYSKIFFRDVGNFFRYLCELVLHHQMRVSNYFVNSFYSVYIFYIVRFIFFIDCQTTAYTASADSLDVSVLMQIGLAGRVYSTAGCAASGHVYSIGDCVASKGLNISVLRHPCAA